MKAIFGGGCAFALAFMVGAQPVIDSVSIKERLEGGSNGRAFESATIVKIVGAGFGEKQRGGPPILWDRVGSFRGIDGEYRHGDGAIDSPFENGTAVSGADERQPWAEASYAGLYGKEDNAVYVKEDGEALEVKTIGDGIVRRVVKERTSEDPGQYVVNGPQGFIGKPREYGGKNPPPGNDYLYVSWWVKQKYHPARVSNYTLSYEAGKFLPGDTFLVEGTRYTGKVLGFPSADGNFAAVVFSDRAMIGAKALGKRLVKTDSKGALITGPGAAVAIPGSPYNSDGSNKFLRVWDNPNGKGFRLSWTQTTLGFGVVPGATKPNVWYTWPGVENEWNHAELEVDLKALKLRAWVNNALFVNVSLESAARDKNFSPTVSLLGWDGQYQYYQLTEFGDIYIDNSLQRVIVSNKATWAEASVAPAVASSGASLVAPRLKEVQYPLKWTDTEIEAEIYVGAYEHCAVDGLYLYVSNGSGVFNADGYKLPGKACPAAPKIL
ncbi:MAG: hypothetical protein II007_07425 [Gammaproteobacteria bacterium]|nr:hypothetical protein [Gammaproteobacteria bacterium]